MLPCLLMSLEFLTAQKNKFLQWKAYATRAFYLNASESIKRHDLSSHGPRQDSSVWVSDPGNILLEWLYSTQAMSCRIYRELHLCVSFGNHQLFLCQVACVLVFSYSFIWQSYHLLLSTTVSLIKIIVLVFIWGCENVYLIGLLDET